MAKSPISEDALEKNAIALKEQEYKERINHFINLNEQFIDSCIISNQNRGIKPPYRMKFLICSVHVYGEIHHVNYNDGVKLCEDLNIDPNVVIPDWKELFCLDDTIEVNVVFDKICEIYKKNGWIPGPLRVTLLASLAAHFSESSHQRSYEFDLDSIESNKIKEEKRKIEREKEKIEREHDGKKWIEDMRKYEERKKEEEA